MRSAATIASADLDSVDLGDAGLWRDGPPHELFARLRRERPVHWSELRNEPREPGFWSLTRARDVAAASRDTTTFSSERGGVFMYDELGADVELGGQHISMLELQRQQLTAMDPPRHDRLKGLFQRGFTPKRVEDHAARIRAIVAEVLDELDGREEADLVADVATKVPARVIADLLGAPRDDVPRLLEFTELLAGAFIHDAAAGKRTPERLVEAFPAFVAYVDEAVETRRRAPTDDLTSALARAELDGERLHNVEIAIFWAQMMFAGNDSTRATYANGMRALLEHPDQLAALRGDPSLLPNAVEEMLRCYPPFSHFRRTATREVTVAGQTIAEGDKVVLWYVSSCYDEELCDDPARFDVTRPPVEHHAFGGGGRHFCLGASLARLELRIWLEETLRRCPDMALAGPPERVLSTWLNQLASLPVRLVP